MSLYDPDIIERETPWDIKVLTGTMPLFGQLLGSDGMTDYFETYSRRASWSWLRLHMGKKNADSTIKEMRKKLKDALSEGTIDKEQYEKLLDLRLRNLMIDNNTDREIQYILQGQELLAVASTEHLLIPPEEVIKKAKVLLDNAAYQPDMGAVHAEIAEIEGIQIGFQLDPGDIITRKAIRVGFGLRILSCFNPLSFLHTGGFGRFFGPNWERWSVNRNRVLRYKHQMDLDDRITEAYNKSLENIEFIRSDVNRAKSTPLDPSEMRILGAAFPVAFGSGERVVKQIWKRYEQEDSTIWGLAMAASYVARHGKHRRSSPKIKRNLAGAAAGYLFIRDKDAVIDRCSDWLKNVRKLNLTDWR